VNIRSESDSERFVRLRIIDAPSNALKENVMRKLVLSLATIAALGFAAAPAMAEHVVIEHHHHHGPILMPHHHHHDKTVIIKH
jgi:hypothetical protein